MNETGISRHHLFVCLSVGWFVCSCEWLRRLRQAKTGETKTWDDVDGFAGWIAMCSVQETLCQEVRSWRSETMHQTAEIAHREHTSTILSMKNFIARCRCDILMWTGEAKIYNEFPFISPCWFHARNYFIFMVQRCSCMKCWLAMPRPSE